MYLRILTQYSALLVFLIGMMGSGKSTVGRELALRLDLPFYDTDVMISSKVGMSISAYFNLKGDLAFRKQEAKLLENWNVTNGIVATGGGFPFFFNNIENLKDLGIVVYLQCDLEVILHRISANTTSRPLLSKLSQDELWVKLNSLYEGRHLGYEKAHLIVNARGSIERVTDEIIAFIM